MNADSDTLEIECDILVAGGGLGGVAAALAACRAGRRVCLTAGVPWLGGQATAQGVSVLEEHAHIEYFGATASYTEFRRRIRDYYRSNYRLKEPDDPYLNPGNAWGGRLSFEPRAGRSALFNMLRPHVESGSLQLVYGAEPLDGKLDSRRITRLEFAQPAYGRRIGIRATYYLDATPLGTLPSLLGLPWTAGAESQDQTGEPHARAGGPAPRLAQRFTFPFAVDFRPGEDHTIPPPPDYERNRAAQPYSLRLPSGQGPVGFFEERPGLPGPFWTYRRLIDADLFATGSFAGDIALINWDANDFGGGDLLGADEISRQALLSQAKNLSLGFLHWLQTECPRDDGHSAGYPELRLRPDVLGSADGLAQFPYIREARRIHALKTVVEQDVSSAHNPGARAIPFTDSVGLGWYPIDIHPQPGDTATGLATKPFQIPLGALISRDADNLLAAGLNLGVTHITNGCYRLPPVEWNTGEAAGTLAAFCLDRRLNPAAVRTQKDALHAYQRALLRGGVPLYWYTDMPLTEAGADAAHLLGVQGLWPGSAEHLRFEPESGVSTNQITAFATTAGVAMDSLGSTPRARAVLARQLADLLTPAP